MAKKEVTNIELDGSEYSVALSCEYDGARFHIWLKHANTLKPQDSILYKNPTADRNEPGYFDTRTLDQDGAAGRIVVPAMLAQAQKLLPGFKAKLKFESDEKEARFENAQRDDAVKAASRDLLAAAKRALGEFVGNGHSGISEPCRDTGCAICDAAKDLSLAILKAQNWEAR